MLCKATEADLEQMVAFRRKTYGGTRQDALDWLCGIVGLDNILILARDPAPGAKPIPAAMIGAVPVECGHHHGVWLCCMATDPSLQGRGLMPKLLCFCFSRCPAERLICPSKTREIKEKNKRFHRLKFFSFSFCRYSCCFPKSLPSLPGRAGQGIDGLVSSRKSKSSPGTFPNYCK